MKGFFLFWKRTPPRLGPITINYILTKLTFPVISEHILPETLGLIGLVCGSLAAAVNVMDGFSLLQLNTLKFTETALRCS